MPSNRSNKFLGTTAIRSVYYLQLSQSKRTILLLLKILIKIDTIYLNYSPSFFGSAVNHAQLLFHSLDITPCPCYEVHKSKTLL